MTTGFFLIICGLLAWTGLAMRADHMAKLRSDTVDMFYHGYSNYMQHAFPEDELRPLTCGSLTRDPDPTNFSVNDALGNYSLTLIDTLSTLAILAGAPDDENGTGSRALADFQNGIAEFVRLYGDGRSESSTIGARANGFDLDSKVQVFETVIRGLGGLLSAHLFAIGELPIAGYDAKPTRDAATDDPLDLPPIRWPNGFEYDGQLLRLALDLGERLLPAFYTETGIPYPRVNLRHGIPFYTKSPLHRDADELADPGGRKEITETCSAGAGSLTLEFTVLSRLSGDPRFELAAKRAFWAVWYRRSELDLIGNGIDAEQGTWIGFHSGIGAGMDSFFEYAFKSHILLSGQDPPNASVSRRQSTTSWLDPNSIHQPLAPEMHSSDAFLATWHQAHAAVKRHLYSDHSSYPYYSNKNRNTGQPFTMWIDSLGAFYAGLLALAGEIEEAIEANLVYTALWTRYSAIPERWSISENNVDSGIGWWPGRPEFIESTYYIYRATKDPWYLYVGEMVLKDIRRRCYVPCGWAGLQDVRTGEKQNRMESFFLGETAKYMYLLFDPDHELNKLDAAYVFSTEGHPLLIPSANRSRPRKKQRPAAKDLATTAYDDEDFTTMCPVPQRDPFLLGSATAARPDLFAASRFIDLHNIPNIHGPVESFKIEGKDNTIITAYRATSNHTIYPWTLPQSMLPENGTCVAPPGKILAWIEFPTTNAARSLISWLGSPIGWWNHDGPLVKSLEGLHLKLERNMTSSTREPVWRVSQAGSVTVGRDDNVFFHAERVSHLSDEAFSVLRRSDIVEIELLLDEVQPPHANQTVPTGQRDSFNHQPSSDHDETHEQSKPFLASLFRAMTSVFDPDYTGSAKRDTADQGPLIISWEAFTATGPGAFPVPAIDDTPVTDSPTFNAKDPAAGFPWKTVYLAGHACDGPLPETSSREHHVIVIRRGQCPFSDKLDNIPTFSRTRRSLQLVIVVDEVAEDDPRGRDETFRPLLDREQLTTSGLKRLHGLPMVLMRGIPGDYELFGRAAAVGMRRRYEIHSGGYLVENAVVL